MIEKEKGRRQPAYIGIDRIVLEDCVMWTKSRSVIGFCRRQRGAEACRPCRLPFRPSAEIAGVEDGERKNVGSFLVCVPNPEDLVGQWPSAVRVAQSEADNKLPTLHR